MQRDYILTKVEVVGIGIVEVHETSTSGAEGVIVVCSCHKDVKIRAVCLCHKDSKIGGGVILAQDVKICM
ncbi:hypothetical protein GW17_00002063 [Ensete ventricosum]|nr:hypothetical protein GW17_00002063 [Ensete ventricosum]